MERPLAALIYGIQLTGRAFDCTWKCCFIGWDVSKFGLTSVSTKPALKRQHANLSSLCSWKNWVQNATPQQLQDSDFDSDWFCICQRREIWKPEWNSSRKTTINVSSLFNQMVIYQGNNKKQGEIQVVGKAQWQSTWTLGAQFSSGCSLYEVWKMCLILPVLKNTCTLLCLGHFYLSIFMGV